MLFKIDAILYRWIKLPVNKIILFMPAPTSGARNFEYGKWQSRGPELPSVWGTTEPPLSKAVMNTDKSSSRWGAGRGSDIISP